MGVDTDLRETLTRLLEHQRLAVLATHCGGQPYSSLVAITTASDLTRIWFATLRTTRKFANLKADGRVSLLVDSRSHRDADFHEAVAATVVGHGEELEGARAEDAARRHLARHPHLSDFLRAPTCAMVEVTVSKYIVVQRFQSVSEWALP